MPHFRIETNVPRIKIPADFVTKAVPVLAKALGKPEQVTMYITFQDEPTGNVGFKGTTFHAIFG
ncbi:Macrophage migration inhibitory factor [Operophtera brumata]|uniref:Macrophage migration inhibitory factor n=1 Tax=Operophtera brumata TaxID=104452 RepID=A0A0L7KSD3_OPEBR|nr:Macrophage migration inhibitory factor [Operophtera brumata]